MISRLVTFSVERRWLVLLLTLVAALAGIFALQRLPIDAVPDITNNQVQVNVLAPSLSPDQIERQVSFTIETSLKGIPGLAYTRSLNRNGFAQITAVFTDATDIYFARQQVAELNAAVRDRLVAVSRVDDARTFTTAHGERLGAGDQHHVRIGDRL